MTPEIKLIQPISEQQWSEYFKLRWLLLREPWNQPPGSEKDAFENLAYHLFAMHTRFGAVGVGRVHIAEKIAQIRYMAVVERFRGKGIGTMILSALEQHAIDQGVDQIFLNARENALKFYKGLQYRVVGDAPVLYGTIKHKKMIKSLYSSLLLSEILSVICARDMKNKSVYKVIFVNQGKVYEIYAKEIAQSGMYGFIEIEGLIFGEKSAVVIDPTEEKLKKEFQEVKRSYIPLHSVIRIDEVEREGVAKIVALDKSDQVIGFPSTYSSGAHERNEDQ